MKAIPQRIRRGCAVLLFLGLAAKGPASEPAPETSGSAVAEVVPPAPEVRTAPEAVPAPPVPSSVPILKGTPQRTIVGFPPREEKPVPELEKPRGELEAFYETFLRDRLSVGARYSSFRFDEELRPEDETRTQTYLGYVNELAFEEDSSVTLVVGYELCPYLALEYSQDEVRARTWNFNNARSDGVLKMSGPLYGLTFRLPIRRWFCPYIGLGYAPWKGEFLHETWWTLGYSSEQAYRDLGSPGTARNLYRRIIEVEDDSCSFLYYGLSVKLHRHVELDFSMREIELTSKAAFYQEFDGARVLSREGEFPLNFTTYSLALKAVF